jgi:RNA polymerase sigma-70 factor (ECF subfamily)
MVWRLDTQTEQNLVQAARAGCVESFGRLYEHYYSPMVWLAYSILTDRDLAEDAAQETFAKACAGLADLRRPERFGAWLACICRNQARQVLRGKRRAAPSPEVVEPEARPAGADGHDEAVRSAVEQLPQIYRDVVVLHYYGDLSYEQIHQTLGISIDQIKGRLNRARSQIAEELERQGEPEHRTQNAEHRMGGHLP